MYQTKITVDYLYKQLALLPQFFFETLCCNIEERNEIKVVRKWELTNTLPDIGTSALSKLKAFADENLLLKTFNLSFIG